MKKAILKHLIFLIQKTSIMVGGQAVIEGVMMRVPGAYATAVRNPKGEIKVNYNQFQSYVEKFKLENLIIIRGFVHLIDSMKIGVGTLEWSSGIAEENNKQTNKLFDYFMTLLSFLFAISLFMGIPYYLTETLLPSLNINADNDFIFNIVAGLSRIIIFIVYLYLISHLDDIKRLFQYHGAEHKVIYNFESGKSLSTNNAQKFSTKHPRCGTSFIFILMMVTILSYGIIDTSISTILNIKLEVFPRIAVHLTCLPLVSGLGYEVLKFFARHQKNILFRIMSKPGLWLQHITTSEPDLDQLEISIIALETAFNDKIENFQGQQYNADAI